MMMMSSDYSMVEMVRKSDHRPVYCQYELKSQERQYRNNYDIIVLRMSNLHIEGSNEKVSFVKVCCPLPSNDKNWEERQVWDFAEIFCYSHL